MIETKEKVVKEGNIQLGDAVKSQSTVALITESKKLIFAIVAVIVILALVGIFLPNRRDVTTEVESSLKEVVEVSELSTVEYIYNSTVTVIEEKSQKPKYYIAYEGTVKAGFNLNEIRCERDDENKKIMIYIPEIKINSVAINDNTLDFIFEKDKYDTETTFQEAYKKCYEDLEKKAEENIKIKQMAYESALDGIKAITLPLESRLPEGYTFDYRQESETK